MSDTPPIVLVFAATDPSGGAGLQADMLPSERAAIHHGRQESRQDTLGSRASSRSGGLVADQARCVLEDMPVAALGWAYLPASRTLKRSPRLLHYPDVPWRSGGASGAVTISGDELGAMRDALPQRRSLRRIGVSCAIAQQEDDERRPGRRDLCPADLAARLRYVLVQNHANT
jgi:hydroxymethylpyrimidine/phosphomethylpyrimidine kinase